ncbi:unnamed protein product [Rhizophagus irregularis]|uniref:Uncharacterized protein n=1 Tax=Rhizophagus irregularis TaxID=588596 RepID=A0A2I1FTL9_9GLOM|nr:hypothetical protein RhiirA4_438870 [Rhizophagus irregularis]CAB4406543.1 unnamed protein product [Rhizophagus irregularis]CAB4406544.1 unnamed protein product [Rhizophagus irregularis]
MSTSSSVKFFKITYQENDSEKLFYVKSVWKIDSLKNLSGLKGKIVCELTVTNCYSFWTRDVTLGDLRSTKPNNIRVEKEFCEATYAALSGLESYENRELSCVITIEDDDDAELSWNWKMNEPETSTMALKFTLGTISLYPVSKHDTVKMWQEWMNFFIEERDLFMIKRDNFETRIEDLSEINSQMKEKIESISVDKDNDQKSLTGKFKTVLNKKKRKTKKLINLLSTTDTTEPSNEPLESQSPNVSDDQDNEPVTPNRRVSPRKKSQSPKSKRASIPSKKVKLGKIVESNEDESTEQKEHQEHQEESKEPEEQEQKQEEEEPESILTKTFRGQVIKSRRRLSRKSSSTLDDILVTPEQKDTGSSSRGSTRKKPRK